MPGNGAIQSLDLSPLRPDVRAVVEQLLAGAGQAQLQVAQPMNDVQNISLVAAQLIALDPSHQVDAERLLDAATDIVAGAYIRVADGRFTKALAAAKERVAVT